MKSKKKRRNQKPQLLNIEELNPDNATKEKYMKQVTMKEFRDTSKKKPEQGNNNEEQKIEEDENIRNWEKKTTTSQDQPQQEKLIS